MIQRKKIIISYPAMMIGGSTTSLLSILNRLDYSKYDVDLLLNLHSGELLNKIPKEVNLLPPAKKYTDPKKDKLHRLLSPKYMLAYHKGKIIVKQSAEPLHLAQYIEMKDVEFFREIPGEYDVAIAFLEGKQCKLVARHIKARRKLAWIHINYADSKFNPDYDRESMAAFDGIALVSEDCKVDFDKAFPELCDRTCVIENILSTEYVRSMSNEKNDLDVDSSKINLVSICRVVFNHKGLDRAVEAMAMLKNEGLLKNIAWYIFGDGQDMSAFKAMIEQNGLSDVIFPLGIRTNPLKYLKDMTMFFLPSRFEGKPMAVTEAFMVGLPVLVTEYSSAREQIRDGIDGIITENSTDGIYNGLKALLNGDFSVDQLKRNVVSKDYSNIEEIEKVEKLIDGE